jgi:integral membrane protein
MTLRNFRYIALLEATTFLLLLMASYLKHVNDQPLGVEILGPIHGILFIAYVVLALNLREQQEWSGRTTLLILLGAVLPFGGYVVDRWLDRNARIETT